MNTMKSIYVLHCSNLLPKKQFNIIKIIHETLRGISSRTDKPPFTHSEQFLSDPSDALHRYLQAPLFENKSFVPSATIMEDAHPYFCADTDNEINFLTFAAERGQWPEYGYPEVSMMGESNVGKSSLIKALFSDGDKVHVNISRKPGKTRSLHFFLCGQRFAIVDFPGYGFKMPEHYKDCVIDYLIHRENLRCSFLILDKAHLSADDTDAMRWLNSKGIPFVIVFNKIDSKRSGDLVYDVLRLYSEVNRLSLPTCYSHIFLVSSVTLEGIAYLRTFISVLCGLCRDECSNIEQWLATDTRYKHRDQQQVAAAEPQKQKQKYPKFSRIKPKKRSKS